MKNPHADRRREARIPGKFRVFVANDSWKGLHPLHTLDVSPSGANLLASFEMPPVAGSSVLVKAGQELLVGMVAHVRPTTEPELRGVGFGVCFFDTHPNWWTGSVTACISAPPRAAPLGETESAESLFMAGKSFLDQKNYVMARQKFEQAYRVVPHPLYLAMQKVCAGYQYLSTAFFSKAEESFTGALKITPACNEALTGLDEAAKRMARAAGGPRTPVPR